MAAVTEAKKKHVEEVLADLRSTAEQMAYRMGFSSEVVSHLRERFVKARDVLRRVSSIDVKTYSNGVRELVATFKSSISERKREPGIATVRTLDGKYAKIATGAKIEKAYHTVSVSKYRMKCTCEDALITAYRADRKLQRILRTTAPVASKSILCKHTIAGLALAIDKGVIDKKDADELLMKGILVLGCRYVDSIPKKAYILIKKHFSG